MLDTAFYEIFAEEEQAIRRYLPKDIRASFSETPIRSGEQARPPAGLISIRTQSIIPEAWYACLSGILTRSTGYDHLAPHLRPCRGKVRAGYLPLYCARAVAEQALLMILALSRRLKKQLAHFASFDRDHLTGAECLGKNLCVVGVGNIGREIAAMARGIGMNVRGVDKVKRVSGLEYVPLNKGIAAAEIIACALPLTDETRGMLNYHVLSLAPRGAFFINIGRCEISPVRDLKRLLDDGVLGGLALDNYEDENRWRSCHSAGFRL
jgi:D-lactate dehydrogenase